MGVRPRGSSRKVDTSKSPKIVIATVLGIGVAVITNTWGGVLALERSASRCSTPNRCCSSTITKPRSAKSTPWESSAWVPIMIPASPDEIFASASRFCAAVIDPVSNTTCVPRASPSSVPACASGPNSFEIVAKCCCASTSVGASSAAWPPESITVSAARRATTVFPEPTSPCNSRCMGWVDAISDSISLHTAR